MTLVYQANVAVGEAVLSSLNRLINPPTIQIISNAVVDYIQTISNNIKHLANICLVCGLWCH